MSSALRIWFNWLFPLLFIWFPLTLKSRNPLTWSMASERGNWHGWACTPLDNKKVNWRARAHIWTFICKNWRNHWKTWQSWRSKTFLIRSLLNWELTFSEKQTVSEEDGRECRADRNHQPTEAAEHMPVTADSCISLYSDIPFNLNLS